MTSDWLPWVEPLFTGLRRDEIFSQSVLSQASSQLGKVHLYGPIPHFVGSLESLRTREPSRDYQIHIFNAGELPQLDASDWPHTVFDRPDPQRPEKVAALAYDQETVIGVAMAVADSDTMWQIGIDVTPDFRGKGLGAALTATIAKATLEAGVVPYYATSPANIPSIRTALSAGLWPCWVQVSCAWH